MFGRPFGLGNLLLSYVGAFIRWVLCGRKKPFHYFVNEEQSYASRIVGITVYMAISVVAIILYV